MCPHNACRRRKWDIPHSGVPGFAVFPTEQYGAVAEVIGFLRRKQLAQLIFHLCRIFSGGEPQQVGNADAVGVAYDGGLVVDVAHNQVGSFPAYTRQLGQLFHSVRQNAVILVQQHLGHGDDILGLGVIESAGTHHLFQFSKIRRCEILQALVLLIQILGYNIDPGIGALAASRVEISSSWGFS